MKIKVIRKDIRGAKRDDWESCPLARAIKRLYPGNAVEVFDERIYINGWGFDHTDGTKAFALGWNEGPMSPTVLDAPDFQGSLRGRMVRMRKPTYSALVNVLTKLVAAYDAGLLAEAEPNSKSWRKESDAAHKILQRVREAS